MAINNGRKFQNYVQKDGVIKEQVNWDRKLKGKDQWNYYDINEVCRTVALKDGLTEQQYNELVRKCSNNKKTPIETEWRLVTRQECPKTTAGEIGWRHEPGHHNLEIYGMLYKSPKLTMMPLYEPAEVIFLG